MTKVMKFEIVTYLILKVLGYASGIVGGFVYIGAAGGLERGTLTFGQFWLYELGAVCALLFCFLAYYVREALKRDCRMRSRKLNRKAVRTH